MKLDNLNELENNNNLDNNSNENNALQGFIRELKEFLEKQEKKLKGESINQNEKRKETSLLEDTYAMHKITVRCRDEINVGIMHVLNETSLNDINGKDIYFIHSKDIEKGLYNASIYSKGKAYNSKQITEKELPVNAGVDSVLRVDNNKYVLDEALTNKINAEVQNVIKIALENQDARLQKARVEGHVYKAGEVEKDRVWLIDETELNTNGSTLQIEEIEFPEELLRNAKSGELYQYINGKYCRVK